jgi:hypothetical protein
MQPNEIYSFLKQDTTPLYFLSNMAACMPGNGEAGMALVGCTIL